MRAVFAAVLTLLTAACAIAPTQPISSPETATVVAAPTPAPTPAPLQLVTLDSRSPLITIRVMVKSGSTSDPIGKEGLAAITAESVIQGGFGSPLVTKERLAEITQAWGEDALPVVLTSSDTTTFRVTVPRDVLSTYIDTVLRPMFSAPQFTAAEIERLKDETKAQVTAARFEDLENLGMAAIDEYVNEGTRYQHPPFGTELGVASISRDDVVGFFQSFYRSGNIILGVSTTDAAVTTAVADVFRNLNGNATAALAAPVRAAQAPTNGRQAVIIDVPSAPAAGVHLGFPLALDRSNPDYWALYVANTWFGTHRDSFGRLYQAIRQERGYNYGDYSYIEHWVGRTFSLFQIFNQPRKQQYFSVWIRPIGHDYAYPMMKAATYELDRMITAGLTDEQVAAAKNKAKVLYVNLGETIDRLLAAKMDDAFYGTSSSGFLESYLENVDKVTTQQVNAALRKYLQTQNIKYVVATDSTRAAALAEQIRRNQPAFGKSMTDYQFEQVKLGDGKVVWQIPEEKLEMLRVDALWADYPLNVMDVRVVPVTSLFKSGQFIDQSR